MKSKNSRCHNGAGVLPDFFRLKDTIEVSPVKAAAASMVMTSRTAVAAPYKTAGSVRETGSALRFTNSINPLEEPMIWQNKRLSMGPMMKAARDKTADWAV